MSQVPDSQPVRGRPIGHRDATQQSPARIVVLLSGAGSLLQALIDATADPEYGVQLVAVGSDRPGVAGLERAERAGVPTFVVRLGDHPDRPSWDAALTQQVEQYQPDLVVSAGFLKLVGEHFLARYGGRYLNSHNTLLPAFPGIHGPRDALEYGVKVTGATLFLVDEGVDTGAVVAQCAVPVLDDDTEDTLTERIKSAERPQLVDYVGRMARDGFTLTGRKVTIGVNTNPSTHPAPEAGARPIRRALVSVYDKTGLDELARALHEADVEIVSTGGSAALISGLGIPVTRVEDLTGFPECLDGRVKTLHPVVHAGILADSRRPEHLRELELMEIAAFDLVVSNLYPFTQTVASGAGVDDCVEQIDIGGPSMVRAAAKNYPSVAIVTSPAAYDAVIDAVAGDGFTLAQRAELAAQAFVHTATYDVHVASWMGNVATDTSGGTGFPTWIGATWDRAEVLRYGENPHQRAALYRTGFTPHPGLAQAEQLHGKAMSYNNYVDADAAWRAAHDHGDQPAVAIIKHANPCGIAVGADIEDAYRKAHSCDPVSAYGGIVASNRPLTADLARDLAPVFTEVVLAPSFEPGALEVLTAKKNLRILQAQPPARGGVETRPISGGLLLQSVDAIDAEGDDPATWTLAAGSAADEATLQDLAFAWRAVRAVKSNAILLADDGASVGVGMGQVNRVDSCRLAVERAADRAGGSVAASDAFFPFADGLQILIDAGIRAVVSPGGSIRDEEVIAAAEQAGVTLYFTGTRHFAH